MHSRLGVVVMLLLMMFSATVVSSQDDDSGNQWASSALASSEYGSDAYSAMQATGEPDALQCGDSTNAWASLEAGGTETLTVYFDELVQARQINIYINYNPGTITSVSLLTPDGSPVEIPNSAGTDTDCPGVHSIAVPSSLTDFFTNAVQIELDQSITGDWTEIDAVELVAVGGSTTGGPGSSNNDGPGSNVSDDTVTVPDGPLGEQVFCDGRLVSENGVVFTVVQMRPNSNYTATVIGKDGFDPVLVVRDAASGDGICNDDNNDAAYYGASLPTSGFVEPNSLTASLPFNTGGYSNMANIEIVVGGLNSQPGEFVLILEGMLLSQADGAGDPLAINISPGMVLSGIDPTVYMFSIVQSFDPLIAMVDGDYNFLADQNGNTIFCDDAGNESSCWGESFNLRDAAVSRTQSRTVSGANTDAMLTMPISVEAIGGTYIPIMRSYEMRTYGDYVAVFHVGIGDR